MTNDDILLKLAEVQAYIDMASSHTDVLPRQKLDLIHDWARRALQDAINELEAG